MNCKSCKPFVLIFMQNDGGGGAHTLRLLSPGGPRFSIFYFLFSIFDFPISIFRHFFLPAGGRSFSSSALIAFTSAAPLARNSPMRSRATCSSSFSPRGVSFADKLANQVSQFGQRLVLGGGDIFRHFGSISYCDIFRHSHAYGYSWQPSEKVLLLSSRAKRGICFSRKNRHYSGLRKDFCVL